MYVLFSLQALMMPGLIQQASNPAVAATIFVPTDTAINGWVASLGCNSLYNIVAMNRTLLMDVVAAHFAPATVLALQSPYNASMPTRQGIITATDMAMTNITLRTAAWATAGASATVAAAIASNITSSGSAQNVTSSNSGQNVTSAGAGQNVTSDSVATADLPAPATAVGMQLALVPTNGSWDITAPSQAPPSLVTYNTSSNATASANATVSGPKYLALPPHTLAILLTRTAQSLMNSTASTVKLPAGAFTAAEASMFESLLYGPGNPLGGGARIVMNDLSTCRYVHSLCCPAITVAAQL
jgi:hypothetical protein